MNRLRAFCAVSTALIFTPLCTGSLCSGSLYADLVFVPPDIVNSATAQTEPPPPKPALYPETEAKLKKLVDAAKVEKSRVWNQRMTGHIADIGKTTGLDAPGSKALEAPARDAVAASTAEWGTKFDETLRRQFVMLPQSIAANALDQALAQISLVAEQVPFGAYGDVTQPEEQDAWIKALHQTLTPAQFATWDNAQTARKALVEKQTGDALKRAMDQIHLQETQSILPDCKEIEEDAGLSAERAAQLEALAKTVTDQAEENWRKRIESSLLEMDDTQRAAYSNGRMFFGMAPNESPTQLPAWKQGVAGLLKPEENARLAAARGDIKTRWAHVLGQVMLALLDEKIAFTDAQRTRLEPITDTLAPGLAQETPQQGNGVYNSNYAPQLFYAAAAKADPSKLKAILDEEQLQRWQEISKPEDPPTPASDDQSKPDADGEPEDVEKTISDFLYHKAEKVRTETIQANTLKAEDAVRSAGLDSQVAARLQAAARGAAEEYLDTWSWFTEQQVRSQLQDVTSENIRQRLDAIQDFFFQRNFGQNNRPSVWDTTVRLALNQKQQDAWQKETDARADFHDQAVAAWVVEEFDREFQLTPDQRTKLEPMITDLLLDDSADIMQIFSGSSQAPWFMQGVYSLLPFAGIPDTDLKAILTKDQFDRWRASPSCINANNLWQNIRQMHAQRINGTNLPQGHIRRRGIIIQ